MEQRLILSGPHAGSVVDAWVCQDETWDDISIAEAARIVREHNERQARADQDNPFAGVEYKRDALGFVGRRLAELDIRTKTLEDRTDWIREIQDRTDAPARNRTVLLAAEGAP